MQKYLAVLARLLLAQIFLLHMIIQVGMILNSPTGYDDYQMALGMHGLPGIFAPLTVGIELIFGLALFLGYKTRLSASVLAVYAVFVALALKLGDPIAFMQYLAIAGGYLALTAIAPTACSLDNLKKSS
jgi:putative oxidoreductase